MRLPFESYLLGCAELAVPFKGPKAGKLDGPGGAVGEAEVNCPVVPVHAESGHVIFPLHRMNFVEVTGGCGQTVRRLAGLVERVSTVPGTIAEEQNQRGSN